MYILKEGYALEDLKSLPKDFRKDFQEVLKSGLIGWDERNRIILIRGHLEHNPITNTNQIKYVEKVLETLPNSLLFNELLNIVKGLTKGLTKGLLKVLKDSIEIKIEIPIEIEHKEDSSPKEKKPEKKKYLEFVMLTDDEHKKLVQKFGKKGADEKIEELNIGIGSKGYKYVSHYHAILSWNRGGGDQGDDKSTIESKIRQSEERIKRMELAKKSAPTERDKKDIEGNIKIEQDKIQEWKKRL
jgi:hypothetical protein